jgi:hypothetical protein
VTLTPILPVAAAPAPAADSEPAGGDGSRFQQTLTEAAGRYRTDGAGRTGRLRPADPPAARSSRDQLPDADEGGAEASRPAVGDAPDPAAGTGHGPDAVLLAQAGVVTAVPVPVPAGSPATPPSGPASDPSDPPGTSFPLPSAGTSTSGAVAAATSTSFVGTVGDNSRRTSAPAPPAAPDAAAAPAAPAAPGDRGRGATAGPTR